jgi:hypothetical protein
LLERPCVRTFPVKDTLVILDEDNRMFRPTDYNNAIDDPDDDDDSSRERVNTEQMQQRTYITFHQNGQIIFYKPSVAEILSQLPEETYKIYEQGKPIYLKNDLATEDVRFAACPRYNNLFHIAITKVFF